MRAISLFLSLALILHAGGVASSALASGLADREAHVLDLGDGYRVTFRAAGENPPRLAVPRTLYVTVSLSNRRDFEDRQRLIEAADRVFETVVLAAAEQGGYDLAEVRVGQGNGAVLEAFTYGRGSNDVWLRQAGAAPWKVAQSTAWTPPASRRVDIKGVGTLTVDQPIALSAPEGFRKAVEIDIVSKSPIISVQQKYREIRAFWTQADRARLLREGVDLVLIGNFSTPQLGRFHLRRGYFVRIPKLESGAWAELPERAPDAPEALVSENAVPVEEITRSIRMSFASGLGTIRMSPVMLSGLLPVTLDGVVHAGFAQGSKAVRLDTAGPGVVVP